MGVDSDTGPWILDTGPDSYRSWMLDAGYLILYSYYF